MIGLCELVDEGADNAAFRMGLTGERDLERSELGEDERLLQFRNHKSGVMRPRRKEITIYLYVLNYSALNWTDHRFRNSFLSGVDSCRDGLAFPCKKSASYTG